MSKDRQYETLTSDTGVMYRSPFGYNLGPDGTALTALSKQKIHDVVQQASTLKPARAAPSGQ